ncbi:MAG: helix-turn-helix transcriptional regulator [Methanobacterium sp.]|uniref:winged helix-turn-helix transcriptional regulator n=1 Tax=Methanobacterium sp. TaxID=2164 RepID=UPI003D64CD79|nr:helix-turn-helix transcriptional regulator [Methanobacterium sp.]
MQKESNYVCECKLCALNTISKKWAILVIESIGNHEKIRFNGIMENVKGISPKSLSNLLKNLQEEELIQRESFSEIPPRVEYSLTDTGKELLEILIPIIEWAKRRDHLYHEI